MLDCPTLTSDRREAIALGLREAAIEARAVVVVAALRSTVRQSRRAGRAVRGRVNLVVDVAAVAPSASVLVARCGCVGALRVIAGSNAASVVPVRVGAALGGVAEGLVPNASRVVLRLLARRSGFSCAHAPRQRLAGCRSCITLVPTVSPVGEGFAVVARRFREARVGAPRGTACGAVVAVRVRVGLGVLERSSSATLALLRGRRAGAGYPSEREVGVEGVARPVGLGGSCS